MVGIWRICRTIGQPLLWAAAWVGIIFLPKDTRELDQAMSVWQELIQRDTALFIFSGALVLWIIYKDLSPFVYRQIGHQPSISDKRWRPRGSNRLESLKRILFPVTIEINRVLHMNSRSGGNFVEFSVYAVAITGRNNRDRDIAISGYLQVENKRMRIPLFVHVHGENQTQNGVATVGPFESFVAYASLPDPDNGTLISDNKISDALFLKDYTPFSVMFSINAKNSKHRFSYGRIRAEIDHERDRVLFYDQNKND